VGSLKWCNKTCKLPKILEHAKVIEKDNRYVIQWNKLKVFPEEIVLRIEIIGKVDAITQLGLELKPVQPGVYQISFDAEELTLFKADINR